MKRLIFLLMISAAAAVLFRTFVIEGIYIASASMEPTLPVGTKYFLEKITVRFRAPARGDIVVFPSPIQEGKDLVKRVIAAGGDTLEIRNKIVFLNGERLTEKYAEYKRSNETLDGDNIGPLAVPAKSLFVMGDNRDESGDSRDWKNKGTGEHIYFVPVEKIKGKIILFY